MYEITVLSHFAAAHQLRHLRGQCEELHGHNWKIEVTVASPRLGGKGIVLDFGVLKQEVTKVVKSLDHSYLNGLPYFSKKEPSSENIAKYIFEQLAPVTRCHRVALKRVCAWESETAYATYLGR